MNRIFCLVNSCMSQILRYIIDMKNGLMAVSATYWLIQVASIYRHTDLTQYMTYMNQTDILLSLWLLPYAFIFNQVSAL